MNEMTKEKSRKGSATGTEGCMCFTGGKRECELCARVKLEDEIGVSDCGDRRTRVVPYGFSMKFYYYSATAEIFFVLSFFS